MLSSGVSSVAWDHGLVHICTPVMYSTIHTPMQVRARPASQHLLRLRSRLGWHKEVQRLSCAGSGLGEGQLVPVWAGQCRGWWEGGWGGGVLGQRGGGPRRRLGPGGGGTSIRTGRIRTPVPSLTGTTWAPIATDLPNYGRSSK